MEPELQRRVQRYGWDKAATYYEDSWSEQLKPAQNKMLEMINLKPGENVVETSCGTGLVTFRITEQVKPGGRVTATDLSDKMIEIAESEAKKQQISNVTFHRMDAEKLDLEESRFEAAVCGLGLMYFPYPEKALKEMHRVLKPGGRGSLAIWGERKACGWADIFPIVDKRVSSDVCPLFFQQGTGNTLQLSMEKAGFTDVQTERLQVTLHYPDEETALMAAFAGGPVALAYRKFDERTKADAHQEYLKSIETYRKNDRYEIPGEFLVGCGVKPS